jgi:hydrogenase nickel incorporation protein HypB
MRVEIDKNLQEKFDVTGREIRALLDMNKVFLINMISSPGAGKTSLIEKILERHGDRWKIGVIEGDIETDIDAERIRKYGVFVHQINTRSSCHIQPGQLREVLSEVDLKGQDLLFVENVGNLVCPAEVSLGEHLRMVLLSVPEGDEKPLKYPLAFKTSQVLIISKTDLLEFVDFEPVRVRAAARALNPHMNIFGLSAKRDEGIDELVRYIEEKMRVHFGK